MDAWKPLLGAPSPALVSACQGSAGQCEGPAVERLEAAVLGLWASDAGVVVKVRYNWTGPE